MQTCIPLLLLVIFNFSTVISTMSQHWDSRQSGTEAFSTSGASSTLKNEFSVFNNPSTLSFNKGLLIGLAAHQLYLTDGLNTASIGISYSTGKIGIGLGVERFGDQILNKSRIKTGLSHKIGSSSIGAAITLYQDYVEGYGYSQFIGVEASSITQLTDKITVSVIINNPIVYHTGFKESSSEAMSITSGISYGFTNNFKVYLDFQKSSLQQFNARIGAVYGYKEKLLIYIGLLTKPLQHSLGVGYRKGIFEFQIGSSIHPSLGVSSSGSIILKLFEKDED